MEETLRKYDDIRPFEPEELPAVYDKLLADPQFMQVVAYLYPEATPQEIGQKMHACKTNMEFQLAFCYQFLKRLMEKASQALDMDVEAIDVKQRYTFVSNHRDIVLDSALLDLLLVETGFKTTCEIAIGDNLLTLPWVKDLVRVNKSFIVQRSLSPREMLAASKRMSEYMRYVIERKHDNIWIAQREGRAKDSNDRTQPALIKMMALGGTGSMVERLAQLHIVPLAISYEYDPCDYLKAREMQLRRDVEGWKKSAGDDLMSMRTGIFGYKGHVHYHCAPCIDEWLIQLDPNIPRTEIADVVAQHLNREIHRNYCLYPNNYVALDLLMGSKAYTDVYSEADRERFIHYIDGQLAKVGDLPKGIERDEAFLREQILTMYAYPLINYLIAR